jgi:restriction system protein
MGDSIRVSGVGTVTAVNATTSIATLLLKSIVLPGPNASEGQLIQAVAEPWFEIIEAIQRDPTAVHQIPARRWEEIVAGAYERAGFEEVILTPRSGDFGRDIIAVKHGVGTIRVIDQVKAYAPGHLVTADDVRALLGVLHADHASKGFLTTTSDFAPRLREDLLLKPFIPSQLGLVNGTDLIAQLERLARHR